MVFGDERVGGTHPTVASPLLTDAACYPPAPFHPTPCCADPSNLVVFGQRLVCLLAVDPVTGVPLPSRGRVLPSFPAWVWDVLAAMGPTGGVHLVVGLSRNCTVSLAVEAPRDEGASGAGASTTPPTGDAAASGPGVGVSAGEGAGAGAGAGVRAGSAAPTVSRHALQCVDRTTLATLALYDTGAGVAVAAGTVMSKVGGPAW
jgi:hypothetical protein